jgi:Uma2 family endonuclease
MNSSPVLKKFKVAANGICSDTHDMSAVERVDFISVEDYLSGEPLSEVKHEYVDGRVSAMAGASRNHNEAVGGCYLALAQHLAGKTCRPYFSDVKVRLLAHGKDIFYYPDVVVGCDPRDTDEHFLRFPKLIIEVLSKSTQRLDSVEKFQNYATIPSLEEYVLVAQDRVDVRVYRKRTAWAAQYYMDIDMSVELESVDLMIPLNQIYRGVKFPAPSETSDD